MLIKQRMYLTADQKRLVEEGHLDAAFLYSIPGRTVADKDAKKYGIKNGYLPKATKAVRRAGDKAMKQAEDKAAKKAPNKGGLTIIPETKRIK